MTIKAQIENAIAKIFSSGKADEFIEKAAEKAVKESIDNAFRTYGTVGKQIEEHIGESLRLNIPSLNLQSYNHTIAGMVKKITLQHLEQETARVIGERLEFLLKPAPAEITVQGIVDHFIEEWKSDGNFSINPDITIEQSTWSSEATTIKLWKDGKDSGLSFSKREKIPDMDIYVSKNQILIPRLKTDVFTSRIDFDLESFVYLMAVQGTKITDAHTVHADEINLSLHDD